MDVGNGFFRSKGVGLMSVNVLFFDQNCRLLARVKSWIKSGWIKSSSHIDFSPKLQKISSSNLIYCSLNRLVNISHFSFVVKMRD